MSNIAQAIHSAAVKRPPSLSLSPYKTSPSTLSNFSQPLVLPESTMKCFISLMCLVAIASATKFDDCGSTAQVSSVQVNDCPDTDDTCKLVRGTKKTINIAFSSKGPASAVTAVVHGVIGGVPLPFSLPNPDGCAFGGLACPLENGKSYTYSHVLDIKKSYPPLGVKVRWELKDDKQEDIVCVEIPCHIE